MASGGTATDNIVCKCGTSFKTRQKHGTVQCGTCLQLAHLACYNLSKGDTVQEGFEFTCAGCSTSETRTEDAGTGDSHPSSAHRTRARDENLTSPDNSTLAVCLCSGSSSCALCKNSDHAMLCKRVDTLEEAMKKENRALRRYVITLEEKIDNLEAQLKKIHSNPPTYASVSGRGPRERRSGYRISNWSPKSGQPSSRPFRKANRFPTEKAPLTILHGFRIVWGTLASTSAEMVHSKLLALILSVQSDSVSVTKSFRSSPNSEQKSKWWFTVSATDDTLRAIDTAWSSIPTHLRWKLQESLRPATISGSLISG